MALNFSTRVDEFTRLAPRFPAWMTPGRQFTDIGWDQKRTKVILASKCYHRCRWEYLFQFTIRVKDVKMSIKNRFALTERSMVAGRKN